MRRGLKLGALALALAAPVAPAMAADAQTLADIRAELQSLAGEIQGLRQELVASGAQGMQAAGGASALQRMDAMEAELSQLTSRTEELGNRIDRVVSDGSNRLGDLEFRLCELEEGCDVSTIGQTPLGGAPASAPVTAPAAGATPAPAPATSSLAMNEQSDFDRAKGVLGQGDFRGAADQFATFAETYPGGPLTGEAMYLRGDALRQAGDTAGAARAWLDAFSADPTGTRAPDNLLGLGQSLGALGQKSEACATLGQVPVRFPAAPAAAQAQTAMQGLGCP